MENEEVKDENNIIETLENQNKEWQDKYLRLLADFDNYKKNQAKREADKDKYRYEPFIKEILEIADVCDSIIGSGQDVSEDASILIKYINGILEKHDVKKIPTNGTDFDYDLHEAVAIENNSDMSDNMIVETWKEGYTYKDKVIRFAKVKVNKH